MSLSGSSDAPPASGTSWFPDIPRILPHEKVFTIQIGRELFRLSGASISSDAPSYFSQFFERQLKNEEEGHAPRTLYIDRDSDTFQDIARHLQGYHISPKDGPHFVRLFADAQFYSLPKLISQLFESEIYISIGASHFQINRDLFNSPGNSPNYFTLGFAVFFSNPAEIFPGLSRDSLLRPPSILPPEVPNRSGAVFAEIIHLLRGYPVQIRSEEHRAELLRDCKYFHLKGLEQKLIPHEISFNPRRGRHEIVIRLDDITRSGISVVPDVQGEASYAPGWVNYARPYVDDTPRELVLEIGGETTKLDYRAGRAEFLGQTKQRVSAFLQVVANKLGLPTVNAGVLMVKAKVSGGHASGPSSPGETPLSEDRVKVRFGGECAVILDGEEWHGAEPEDSVVNPSEMSGREGSGSPAGWTQFTGVSVAGSVKPGMQHTSTPRMPQRKRVKRRGSMDDAAEWIIKRGQWRVRIQTVLGMDGRPVGFEAILVGVKLEAFSGEYGRNASRGFL